MSANRAKTSRHRYGREDSIECHQDFERSRKRYHSELLVTAITSQPMGAFGINNSRCGQSHLAMLEGLPISAHGATISVTLRLMMLLKKRSGRILCAEKILEIGFRELTTAVGDVG
jgi:hypothetical protein